MLLTALTFIGILLVLVLVHEWGHFFSARKLGVEVEEFGFGFPPRIASVQKKGTTYSFNWLPLGGFVKLKGEDSREVGAGSFMAQKPWRRAVIICAGVVMNVVLVFVLLSVGFGVGFPTVAGPEYGSALKDVRLQLVEVLEKSPAAEAGLVAGDSIISVDNKVVLSQSDLQSYLNTGASHPVTVVYEHDNKTLSVSVTPVALTQTQGKYALGISFLPMGTLVYSWYEAVWQGARETVVLTGAIFSAFGNMFKDLVVHQHVPADVAGPVGIAVITGQVVQEGWIYVLQFAALLSLNLAIINVLPLPALDGGRLLFILIEKIRRKPNNERIEAIVHRLGFALLMLLVLLVTYRDLLRLGGTMFGK